MDKFDFLGLLWRKPDSLAPGAKLYATASFTITQAELDAGYLTNVATGKGTPPKGDDVTATDTNKKDDGVFIWGAKTLSLTATELFSEPELLLAAKKNFEQRKAGRPGTTGRNTPRPGNPPTGS